MKRILIVFGTRPEAIKLWPLTLVLKVNPNIELLTLNTGQHEDMMNATIEQLHLEVTDKLTLQASSNINETQSFLQSSISKYINAKKPDLVVVQGDTSTALISAMCAFNLGIPIAHVEAGLRSFNINHPRPEELYRIIISKMADLHLAPTKVAKENLCLENVPESRIFVVGNTSIDALRLALDQKRTSDYVQYRKYVLVTCHRRESHGTRLAILLQALRQVSMRNPGIDFRFILHLNPNVYNVVTRELSNCKNIILMEPQSYFDFVALMQNSLFIVTDSGGLQEEGSFLGKRLLVYREFTERAESLISGHSKLLLANEESIVQAIQDEILLGDKELPSSREYGDGFAAERILQAFQMCLKD